MSSVDRSGGDDRDLRASVVRITGGEDTNEKLQGEGSFMASMALPMRLAMTWRSSLAKTRMACLRAGSEQKGCGLHAE